MKKKEFTVTPERVAEIIAQASYDLWKDEEFRKMVDFERISQADQDRIFNELEVTLLGLVSLQAEQQPLLLDIQKQVVTAFLKILEDLKIERKHLKEWKLLIKLRLKEYKRDYKIALKEAKSWKDLQDDGELRPVWARVETLTIDSLRHIRGGKVEKDDPLWVYLRKWLTMMEVVSTKALQQSLSKIKIGVC